MNRHDIIIIGGGPAGLAAAAAAREAGVEDVLILERDVRLGGILNQCIHNGFGLHTFGQELTGPEYAERYADKVEELRIPYKLKTIVADVSAERVVTYVNADEGVQTVQAGAIVLAMGCRERPRGALGLSGYRPAGIYTAGTAQRLMNVEGFSVGKKVFILGSGDIGLIMARRLTLEGAQVCCVAELMPYSGGLNRNIVQCLNDFNIPLRLSHTVTRIHGKRRVEGVTVSEVDGNRRPIPGTEEFYECDTLLLSCGLLPENELSRAAGVKLDRVTGGPVVDDKLMSSVPGVFACGNVLHVHDLVDYVSEEAERAGRQAAAYVKGGGDDAGTVVTLEAADGVRYTVPQFIRPDSMADSVTVRFRVSDVFRDRSVAVYYDGVRVSKRKKRIMAPGEMEQITIRKDGFAAGVPGKITVCVED
ncbi:MAG: FAD-dependent oxidoreductase [Clostridia bacterium]|nr:FAD-dependent oxidoreductase [Clostridia bacterium]